MDTMQGHVFVGAHLPHARTSSVLASANEGGLFEPPAIVQQHWAENDAPDLHEWLFSSPVSDPSHELKVLQDGFRQLAEILANRSVPEVPEVLEMPAVATRRILARVRYTGPAPFVFVDELADDTAGQGE